MKNGKTNILIAALLLPSGSEVGLAVTTFEQSDKTIPFIRDIDEVNTGLELPTTSKRESILMQRSVLYKRAARSPKDSRIEPLEIRVPATPTELSSFVKKNAIAGQRSQLFDYLAIRIRQAPGPKESDDLTRKVAINEEALQLFRPDALSKLLAKPHLSVTVDSAALQKDSALTTEFLEQLSRYLPDAKLRTISRQITDKAAIQLDESLLPAFAQRMVGRFTSFRGPNCFQAALAFQGETFTMSKFINVKKESGYHPAMINYDELWRALKAHFYEIDAQKFDLQYGDMLVFMDVPENNASWSIINYRWIRHASTYLFGNYTFSKGSKSPDTPYTVKTIEEEWKSWQNMSKNLGLKVYRRKADALMPPAIPARELEDWIY